MFRNISVQKKGLGNFLKRGLGLAAVIMIPLAVPSLEAQTFPNQAVQFIVPFGAGSGSDLIARAIQPYAEKTLGNRLIIANIPGADSRIGMKKLYTAKPDGLAIEINNFPTAIIHEYLFDVPYRALDFSFIYAWILSPQVIFVSEDSSWKSFDDFVLEGRKRPLALGLPGIGTTVHLLAMIMAKHMNVKFNYIPYSGSAQGFAALAGNHIDANVGSADAALGLVQAKKIRPLIIWSSTPDPNFPDVTLSTKYNLPTFAPARGVFGPPNMPEGRVRVLEKAFSQAATHPKLIEWSKSRGYEPIAWNAKQFRQEIEKQQSLVREYKDFLKTP